MFNIQAHNVIIYTSRDPDAQQQRKQAKKNT